MKTTLNSRVLGVFNLAQKYKSLSIYFNLIYFLTDCGDEIQSLDYSLTFTSIRRGGRNTRAYTLCNWLFTYAYFSFRARVDKRKLPSWKLIGRLCHLQCKYRILRSRNISAFKCHAHTYLRSGNSPTTLYASVRRVSDWPLAHPVYINYRPEINLTVIVRTSPDIIIRARAPRERSLMRFWYIDPISLSGVSRCVFASPENLEFLS